MVFYEPVQKAQAPFQVQHAIGTKSGSNVYLLTYRLITFRRGGPLAITDANLVLGRLIPQFFPQIFGPNENEGLDIEASKRGFEKLVEEINNETGGKRSLDEIVYG